MATYIYPVSSYLRITQVYWSQHLGIDLGWWEGYSNQNIVAIADGEVVDYADGWGNTYPSRKIYGNYVIIKHAGNVYSLYGHLLSGVSSYVKKGTKVKQGQTIGRMGNSGYSCGQHLHFEFRKGGNMKSKSVDPVPYLVLDNPKVWLNPSSKEIDRIRVELSPVEPVSRDETRNQIYVGLSNLRCREKPGLNGKSVGLLSEGYYNVMYSTIEDGYTWYEIAEDRWCAKVDKVTFYPIKQLELFQVIFPSVSTGDKDILVKTADRLKLEVDVEQLN